MGLLPALLSYRKNKTVYASRTTLDRAPVGVAAYVHFPTMLR